VLAVEKQSHSPLKSGTHYHVWLRSWREQHGMEELTVPDSFYRRVTAGKTVITVVTKKGYLGFEWLVSYDIEADVGRKPIDLDHG